MKKIKKYISIIVLLSIILLLFIYPQHMETAVKALVTIMECYECLSE